MRGFSIVTILLLSASALPLGAAGAPYDQCIGVRDASLPLTYQLVGDMVWSRMSYVCDNHDEVLPIACNVAKPPEAACSAATHVDQPAMLCDDTEEPVQGQLGGSGWYGTCTRVASANAQVTMRYDQVTVSCSEDGSSCTYAPTFVIGLETLAPGEWVLRATSEMRYYYGGGAGPLVPGSQRSLECQTAVGELACGASVSNEIITGDNLQTVRWTGWWSLSSIDAMGIEHLHATGTDTAYIAQYY